MRVFLFKTAKVIFNTAVFLGISLIILNVAYYAFGENYIDSEPIGGDYYNALTYLVYYAKYQPFPTQGWLPFWLEGGSTIGTYPALAFYAIKPLLQFYDLPTATNIFSFATLTAFLVFSLLLFWQSSKSWIIATTLVIILGITQATYYQLTVGAFIASASSQFYLPLSLFFIFRYSERYKARYFFASALFSGLSMLHHGSIGILMTFLPCLVALSLILKKGKTEYKLKKVFTFVAISTAIGLTGLYTVFEKTLFGTVAGKCVSFECWGVYPRHLITWFNPYPLLIIGIFISLFVFALVFRRKINSKLLLPSLAALSVPLLYSLAAYLKLIDTLSVTVFPTRIFWTINLLALTFAASLFFAIKKSFSHFIHVLSSIILLTFLIIALSVNFKPNIDRPNAVPVDIAKYILPKYQTKNLDELIPSWISSANNTYRIDIFNSAVYQWFNIVYEIPNVRGYFNHLPNSDWPYFLENATRSKNDNLEPKLVENQAKFLVDAFAIKYIENSQLPYLETLTTDNNFIEKSEKGEWLMIKDGVTTPIIHPTNANALLFVGSGEAYESFVRSLTTTNLNSQVLTPARGPEDVNSLKEDDFKNFNIIFLYQYKSGNLQKLEKFVEDGGSIFIDTAHPKSRAKDSKITPFETAFIQDADKNSSFQTTNSPLTKNIDVSKFAPLSFKGGFWKISKPENLKDWAKPVLTYDNIPILAEGKVGNGKIVWSGFNLPFHIVDNNNYEESKLFKNIIESLAKTAPPAKPQTTVKRDVPWEISISGQNFKGVYFKENYDTGWKATQNNKRLKVYKAGTGFMYIPTPEVGDVRLSFSSSFVPKFLFWLSIVTILITTAAIIYPHIFLKTERELTKLTKSKFSKKITKFLEEE